MHPAAARYQEVRATTSTPGELLLALYDGLFRFLRGSKIHLERGEKARASELLSKSYAVVSELYIALDHEVAPELCSNLAGVYGFCMDRIMHANVRGSPEAIDDVLRVLSPLREAWQTAVPAAQQERVRAAAGQR
ncbi:MAG: flagellar export chaperone FliS [Polyangiaceae bacterium]